MTAWRFLFLSLLIHLLWMLALTRLARVRLEDDQTHRPIEVTINDQNPSQKQQHFVKQVTPISEEKKPKDARFLSERDQTVAKETRARNTGATQNRVPEKFLPQFKPSDSPVEPIENEKEQKVAQTDTDGVATPKQKKLRELRKQLFDPGVSSAGEVMPGVADGSMTILNTERFVFYSFFSRIEERIRPLWERNLTQAAATIQKPSRSAKTWVTGVEIIIDADGNVLETIVENPSGLAILDSAATQAFREARIFPNPPKGMLKSDGKVHLRISFQVEDAQFSNPMAQQ
jgi:TonB family protein